MPDMDKAVVREQYLRMSASRYASQEERTWHRRNPETVTPRTGNPYPLEQLAFPKTYCGILTSSFLHRSWAITDVRDQGSHCGTCFPENWMQPPTGDSMVQSFPVEVVTPGHPDGWSLDDLLDLMTTMESGLVDLSREQLRRLAWRALMLSDGPYCTYADKKSDFYQNDKDSMFVVEQWGEVKPNPTRRGFSIKGKRGWET